MRAPYHHFVKEEPLFCRNCSAVTKQSLHSRLSSDLADPQLKEETLLASCLICSEDQVVFARDLRSIIGEDEGEFKCKVGGRGRIVVGDWVYFPGQSKPGQVKMRQRVGEREHFTMVYDDGEEFKWSQRIPNIAGKEALLTYRLVPFQLGSTKIGDYIYHVGRDLTGIAVGIVHGAKEKIIIQLENHSYLIMNLNHRPSPTGTNQIMREKIREAFQSVMGESVQGMDIEVRGGIVYLTGECAHLLEKEALIRFVESIPGVLMVLPKIMIYPGIIVSDDELQWQIHTLLKAQAKLGLVGIRAFVRDGIATVHGFVEKEEVFQKLYNLLACINGLREIHLHLSPTRGLLQEDIEKSKAINEALLKNSALQGTQIHAKVQGGTIFLEGQVRSTFQKSTAALAAAWVCKNISIENNIQIEKPNAMRRLGDQGE